MYVDHTAVDNRRSLATAKSKNMCYNENVDNGTERRRRRPRRGFLPQALVLYSLDYTTHLKIKYEGVLRIGANGACGLHFSAAKRSGSSLPNTPVGLRARVSSLGGFSRPFPG